MKVVSRKVSHYFNTWEMSQLDIPPRAEPEPNDTERICFIDVPQEKECAIYLGNIILPLSEPDIFPFFVLNQVLGGSPISHLFMNLRESKGYAYYAFSELDFFKDCSVFLVRAKVTPEVIYPAVQEILGEMRSLTKERIPAEEVEQSKAYLIGNFPLNIERWDSISGKIAQIAAFELGEDYWNNYYQKIMLVDAERVYEVAQKFPLTKPVIVLAGDRENILKHLKSFEKVEIYDTSGTLLSTQRKE
jgi:predicted Zn-dependent peptidase